MGTITTTFENLTDIQSPNGVIDMVIASNNSNNQLLWERDGSWNQIIPPPPPSADNIDTFTIPSSGTDSFIVPSGVNVMTLSACGAGGGGGGGYWSTAGRGGGGGGYTSNVDISVVPGGTISISVGAGGGGDVLDYPNNSTDGKGGSGGNTTLSGTGLADGTITLGGGVGGAGGYEYHTQNARWGDGGTVTGISGSTGQQGSSDGTYGFGGYSLNGAVSGGYGTTTGYHNTQCWIGKYGDEVSSSGSGTGGGARPDCGPDGYGGRGADGYVNLAWSTCYAAGSSIIYSQYNGTSSVGEGYWRTLVGPYTAPRCGVYRVSGHGSVLSPYWSKGMMMRVNVAGVYTTVYSQIDGDPKYYNNVTFSMDTHTLTEGDSISLEGWVWGNFGSDRFANSSMNVGVS